MWNRAARSGLCSGTGGESPCTFLPEFRSSKRYAILPKQELFQNLIRYLDAADLRILSAFKSYLYLRQKSNAAEKMSPIARAKDHAATVAQAEAAAARNSGHGMSNRRGGGGGGGGGTGILQRRQSSPARVPDLGGGGRHGVGARDRAGAAGEEADVLSEVTVPVSLINLVVHADQRRAPLRMFHFADALPAQPPPPPPPPAHNTPSPRLMSSRVRARGGGGGAAGGAGTGGGGGPGAPGGGRDSGEVGQLLPTTREDVVASSATMVESDATGPPGQAGDDHGSGAPTTVRRCATCETLPVVCIEDGEGEGAVSVSEKGRSGGQEGDGRGRGGSVEEGDISANEQVHT